MRSKSRRSTRSDRAISDQSWHCIWKSVSQKDECVFKLLSYFMLRILTFLVKLPFWNEWINDRIYITLLKPEGQAQSCILWLVAHVSFPASINFLNFILFCCNFYSSDCLTTRISCAKYNVDKCSAGLASASSSQLERKHSWIQGKQNVDLALSGISL